MGLTINDPNTGTEINIGPSDTEPGKVRVTIFSDTWFAVMDVIDDLTKEYGQVEFTTPVLSAGGKYASIGKVWNA